MKSMKKTIAAILTFAMIVMMLPAVTISADAAEESYYEKFGITYEQLFTMYPGYLNPEVETNVVNGLMNTYLNTLREYGGEYDFLPAFATALEKGGDEILASEIFAKFGLGESLEEKWFAETSEALMREILEANSELTSVVNEISDNFSSLEDTYDIATEAGKLKFIKALKSSCTNLTDAVIDEIANSLFEKEDDLMDNVSDVIEFWQLLVGIIQLQELQMESIRQLRDAMTERSDFAKALDILLAKIKKDPVAHILEHYCTDAVVAQLADAIETALISGLLNPGKLTVEVAKLIISVITKLYQGATAGDIYRTTLLSGYVSEFDSAITSHRVQFALAKTNGKLIGQDDISEYEYLYSA